MDLLNAVFDVPAAPAPSGAGRPATPPPPPASERITCIFARRVAWPGLRERSDRAGLRLRWDALTEDGDVLAKATERPRADGSLVLLDHGVAPDALVTMRHEDAAHDSFRPMAMQAAAADALRRRATAERLRGGATICARTANSAPAEGKAPPGPCARPVAHVGAGSGDTR